MITLCACVVSGNGATPFSTSKGSGNGLLEPSKTAIPITGALQKNNDIINVSNKYENVRENNITCVSAEFLWPADRRYLQILFWKKTVLLS